MTDYACFRIGEVFTPGDELSSWIATIASALNDMIATGGGAFPTRPTGHETYASRLATYRQYSSRLEAMRSNGVFHYPAWNPTRGAIRHGLATAAHGLGIVKIHDAIGGRRFLFADEIILATWPTPAAAKPRCMTPSPPPRTRLVMSFTSPTPLSLATS